MKQSSFLLCEKEDDGIEKRVKEEQYQNNPEGNFWWKIRSYILGEGVGIVRGWCRPKRGGVGDDSKNSQKTGIGVTFAPESCSYIVGGELCHPAGLWEERGIVCLVSDTTSRHNTTFSIIYIFFFYSCNRTRARIYIRIYRNRVSLVGCVGWVAQTGGSLSLIFGAERRRGRDREQVWQRFIIY